MDYNPVIHSFLSGVLSWAYTKDLFLAILTGTDCEEGGAYPRFKTSASVTHRKAAHVTQAATVLQQSPFTLFSFSFVIYRASKLVLFRLITRFDFVLFTRAVIFFFVCGMKMIGDQRQFQVAITTES